MKRQYLIIVHGGTDPETLGPFPSGKKRDACAREVWQASDGSGETNLFRATVDAKGRLSVSPFVSDELDAVQP